MPDSMGDFETGDAGGTMDSWIKYLQLLLSVSAVPPANGVVQLNVVLNRYLSLACRAKPKVQLLTMFSRQ
jgi:hypothetical protein